MRINIARYIMRALVEMNGVETVYVLSASANFLDVFLYVRPNDFAFCCRSAVDDIIPSRLMVSISFFFLARCALSWAVLGLTLSVLEADVSQNKYDLIITWAARGPNEFAVPVASVKLKLIGLSKGIGLLGKSRRIFRFSRYGC